LDRERVVASAVAMTSRAEGQPLTFRALGDRLGVDPSALYRYVSSKDELLLAVADGIIGGALGGFTETGRWKEDLAALLGAVRRAFLEHPEVGVAAAPRITRLPAETALTETILRLLESAGIKDGDGVLAYRALEDTMLAWTGFSAAVELSPSPEADREDWRATCLAAGTSRFPRTVRQAINITEVGLERGFEAAIDLMLAGLESRLQSTQDGDTWVTSLKEP
jgi:AcrR family transcriptional regulator